MVVISGGEVVFVFMVVDDFFILMVIIENVGEGFLKFVGLFIVFIMGLDVVRFVVV